MSLELNKEQQSKYKKHGATLKELIASCAQSMETIDDKIKLLKAESKALEDAINLRKQMNVWEKDSKLKGDPNKANVLNPGNKPVIFNCQLKTYQKKLKCLENTIKHNTNVYLAMADMKLNLNYLIIKINNLQKISSHEFKTIKDLICSIKNQNLLSQHSKGWEFFSKVYYFFNRILTKTTGLKLFDRVNSALDPMQASINEMNRTGVELNLKKTTYGF